MIELIGWQNPLVEFKDVPLHIRIYEQIMFRTREHIGPNIGTATKPTKPVVAWHNDGTIIRFKSSSVCASYFDVCKNTILARIKDGKYRYGWTFQFEFPEKEEE